MLLDLQSQFLESIYEQKTDFLQHVVPSHHLSASQSLKIYQDSVYANLIIALSDIYPVCKALVGDEFFDAMAERYIHSQPPNSDRLDDYGANFFEFIAHFEPAKELPYLPDMAKLEWAGHCVFHAEDSDYAETNGLLQNESIDPMDLMASNIPALQALSLDYAVHLLWQMHWEDNWQEMDLHPQPTHLVVWRPESDIFINEIEASEQAWFTQLQSAVPLWQLAESQPEFDTLFVSKLQKQQLTLIKPTTT